MHFESAYNATLALFIQRKLLSTLNFSLLNETIGYWLHHRQRSQQKHDLFPVCVASAVSDWEKAVPLGAFWSLSILAARILDDLADNEGQHRPWMQLPQRQLPALAMSILSTAQSALAYLDVAPTIRQEISVNLGRTIALSAKAQVELPKNATAEQYLSHIVGCTGLAWSAIAWAGGRLGTAHTTELNQIQRIGHHLGMFDAIFDDINDLQQDLQEGQHTLPLIVALSNTQHPLQPHLNHMLSQPLAHRDVHSIIQLIHEMEASRFCQFQAQHHMGQAATILQQLPNAYGVALTHYVS